VLAIADAELSQAEIDHLTVAARGLDLSYSEVYRQIASKELWDFARPDSIRERYSLLFEMYILMMADGEANPREIAYCKVIAKGYGFPMEIVDDMINLFSDVDMLGAAKGDRLELSRLNASTSLIVQMYSIPAR
jgi:hypothetical protein